MLKFFLTMAILALVSSSFLVAQPKIAFEGDGKAVSFGDVMAGAKITRDILVKNVGTDTLRVSNVRAQCGCTATQLDNMNVPPGGASKMKVTFDSKNQAPGKAVKHIYLTSNSKPDSIASFEFTAMVTVALTLNPPFFNFNQAKLDTTYIKTMTVSNTSSKPITIEGVKTEAQFLSLKLGKKHLKPGESTELEATLFAKTAGPYQGTIEMKTDNPDQPKVDIRYHAWINRK